MERYLAIVEAGIVTNVIVVDPKDAATIAHFGGLLLPLGAEVSIDWRHDGTTFLPPLASAPPPYVPSELEVLKQVLEDSGVLTAPRIAAATATLTTRGKK